MSHLESLPIYIGDINNGSTNILKATLSSLNATFEGHETGYYKYRLYLPKGYYKYILEGAPNLLCNKDIFNRVLDSPKEDTFLDFQIKIFVPYGVNGEYKQDFYLYVIGGLYQKITLSVPSYKAKTSQLDKWDFKCWSNPNSTDFKVNENVLSLTGLNKKLMESAVYQYDEPLKPGHFYELDIDISNINYEENKFSMSGLRIFQDGSSGVALGLSKDKVQSIVIKDSNNYVSKEKECNANEVQKLGIKYKGDDIYEFWYLGKYDPHWQFLDQVEYIYTENIRLGIFNCRNEDELIIRDFVKVKY